MTSNTPPSPVLNEEEYRLCARVCYLYYEKNMTQDDIGKLIGFSRVKINRVLRQARESGIVEIRIHTPSDGYFQLEDSLMKKYGLRDIRIVQNAEPGHDLYMELARGGAGWLAQHIEKGMCIGIGLGRTVSFLPQAFRLQNPVDCTFTEVIGAASTTMRDLLNYNVTAKLAELAGGRSELFYAPTFVSNSDLKNKLIAEPSVVASLERARKCQIVLQSIGPLDESALLVIAGQIKVEEIPELHRLGVVGDALGHFFDENGQHIKTIADDRVIGLDLQDLHRIPWSVLIGGGAEKIKPIDSALRGKLFNVLITNYQTALALDEEKSDAQ